MNHSRFIEAARVVALSAPKVSLKRARVGAVLVKRGIIVASAHNELKTHPKLLKYTNFPYLHAETSCLIRHGLDNCTDSILYVCRVGQRNDIRMAKPCEICQAFMKDFTQLNAIYFTDENGEIKCL